MKHLLLFSALLASLSLIAQEMSSANSRAIEVDKTVVTTHSTTIKGKSVAYRATTGTQPVWDDDGKAIAAVHYTYYERTDVRNKASRPVMISFNGGPGSGSVWMHLAYTRTMILKVDDEGFPVQPYGSRVILIRFWMLLTLFLSTLSIRDFPDTG